VPAHSKLRQFGAAAAFLGTLVCLPLAAQENYPARPLRLIVPYTPGASTDALARAFTEEAAKLLGKPIVVENRGGAGTAIGTQAAVQAPADGYTLLFGSGTMVSSMHAMKDPGYRLSDLAAVVMLADQVYVLMTPAALPAKSLGEFVAHARVNSARINYGMLGPGSPSHVLADRLARAANFEWQAIAYRGGAPTLQALMANEIQGYFATQSYAMTFLNSNRVRILAIGAEERGEFLPDIPTFKEGGVEGMAERGWYAVFVRSETPPGILARLRAVGSEVMNSAWMRTQLRSQGLSSYKGTLETFPAALARESAQKAEEAKRYGSVTQ